MTVPVDLADAPGHRVGGGHGRAQPVADEDVLGVVGAQVSSQRGHGRLAVDVVGIGDGKRNVATDRVAGGEHGVHGTEGPALRGVVDGHPAGHTCSTW